LLPDVSVRGLMASPAPLNHIDPTAWFPVSQAGAVPDTLRQRPSLRVLTPHIRDHRSFDK